MDEYNGYDMQAIKKLCSQVLIMAIQDLDKPKYQEDAEAFFESPKLDWFSSVLGLNPARVRDRVDEGVDPSLLKYARRAHHSEKGALIERAAVIRQ